MKVGDLVATTSRALRRSAAAADGSHPNLKIPAGIVLKLRKDGHNAGPPETAKVCWSEGGEHFECWCWVTDLEVVIESR